MWWSLNYKLLKMLQTSKLGVARIDCHLEDWDEMHMNEKVESNCRHHWDQSRAKIHRRANCKRGN